MVIKFSQNWCKFGLQLLLRLVQGCVFFLFRFGENVLFMADYLGKLSEMTLNVVMVDGMR